MTIADKRRQTWESYSRAWKEQSAEAKSAVLGESVEENCVYTDPLTVARGHRQLIDYMLQFHKQVPGGHFATTWFLTHHDASVAKWDMLDGNGNPIGDGVSYAQYNEAGALVAMTGFFEVRA